MPAKKDFTQVAFDVVRRATGEVAPPAPPTEKQVASRKGGLKGGAKRMADMTDEQRKALAAKAAAARWAKKNAPDHTVGARKV
jgi:hypothetical protein